MTTISNTQKETSRWIPFLVTDIIEENTLTKTIILTHKDHPEFDYKPGQYITCRFNQLAAKSVVRSYSLSSAPCEKGYLSITVKKIPNGLVSSYLCDEIKKGMTIEATRPIGRFCYDFEKNTNHLVMIGAGSGITPFLSILKQNHEITKKNATLIATFPSAEMAISISLLEKISHDEFHHIAFCFSQKSSSQKEKERIFSGRLTKTIMDDICNHSYEKKSFMICGPELFMSQVESWLLENNVDKNDIQKESF